MANHSARAKEMMASYFVGNYMDPELEVAQVRSCFLVTYTKTICNYICLNPKYRREDVTETPRQNHGNDLQATERKEILPRPNP